jgi:hypothetical protein
MRVDGGISEGGRASTVVDPQKGSRYKLTNVVNLTLCDQGPPGWGPCRAGRAALRQAGHTRRQYESEQAALFGFAGVGGPGC